MSRSILALSFMLVSRYGWARARRLRRRLHPQRKGRSRPRKKALNPRRKPAARSCSGARRNSRNASSAPTPSCKAFTEQSGIEVELVPVNEDQLPELLTASAAANTLPDALFFPLDFAIGWAEQGILDYEAAAEVVDELDPATFSQGALDMVAYEGGYAGVPSDGWGQLLIFRKDLFDAAGLETPDTYDKIIAAAEALHDPDNSFYGITAANDVAVFTQQTFEHIALANNCQLVDDAGAVTLDTPECVGAISLYNDLQTKYGPVGQQDVASTRATYFAGQAGMIIWSPFILDEMCGLRENALPTCPECADDIAFLAKNSGFVPAFVRPGWRRAGPVRPVQQHRHHHHGRQGSRQAVPELLVQ